MGLREYEVAIEEVVVSSFVLEARNRKEAFDKAISHYRDELFVLEPGEVQYRQIALLDDESEPVWTEF